MTPTHPVAVVFPGQGSQRKGMLAELASVYPVVVQTFEEASAALNRDLWAIAQQGDGLDRTENTQPVLLTASIALWRLLTSQVTMVPTVMAGHSLGEYSALVAAGAIPFTQAVQLVSRRGQLMQEAVPDGAGAMAAIVGLSDERVIALCETAHLQANNAVVSPANFNAEGQVVIAGNASGVAAASQLAKAEGGKAIPLAVSVPSHCPLMRAAATQFSEALHTLKLTMPSIPVVHNRTGEVAADTANILQCLQEQLYEPVRWHQSMQYIHDQFSIQTTLECGPGVVLSNLVKRLPFGWNPLGLDTPQKLEAAVKALTA